MPAIKANQVGFYLQTRKDDMSVFDFYSREFKKKGWISCRHDSNWFDYSKPLKNHEYIDIRQNSAYMILPEKEQLLVIVAQYFIVTSGDIDIQAKKDKLKQHVKVVFYQLDDRGYAMAVNKYACPSKNDGNH